MAVVKGDKVAVHYTGWLETGEKFDSSVESGKTMNFQIGEGMLIQGFEEAVLGMEIGDKKTVVIPPEKGYGEKIEKYIFDVDRGSFPEGAAIEEGSIFEMHSDKGDVIPVRIIEIKEDGGILLDANHPLAGKTLTFEIELVDVGVEVPDFDSHHGCCCGHEDCDSDDCQEENECDSDSCCGHGKKGC